MYSSTSPLNSKVGWPEKERVAQKSPNIKKIIVNLSECQQK